MKKLVFGLIATVMFGFVSSANPINENKTKNPNTFKDLKTETHPVYCEGIWASVRIYAMNHGCTPDQASCIAFAALFECMGIDATEAKKKIGTLC